MNLSSASRWTRGGMRQALAVAALLAAVSSPARLSAEQFGSERGLTWDTIRRDAAEFWTSLVTTDAAEGATRSALVGAVLAAVGCGVLGSFIMLRRMALFGDMVGHAVLPGIAAGFIIAGSKSTPWLLAGALVSGLLAAGFTRLIRAWSRVKEDAALGIALSLFYALGIFLLSYIASRPDLSAESSGLNRYLFGNPAVIQAGDLWFLGAAAVLVIAVVALFYKEILAATFDPAFARSLGLPTRAIDAVILVLLTVVVVVSLKILGVVLVAAMLTIPPATAYLLTERMHRLCALAVLIGSLSGFAGVFASSVFGIGTGPAVICAAFCFLLAAFVASPRHGVVVKLAQRRRLALRTVRENLLASAYRLIEGGASADALPLEKLAAERRESVRETRRLAQCLRRSGWGRSRGDFLVLTPQGHRRAMEVVRGHRLWELFLAREASLPPERVHLDAEEIEHYLGADMIAELEQLLDHPPTDPHGRAIPRRDPLLREEAETPGARPGSAGAGR